LHYFLKFNYILVHIILFTHKPWRLNIELLKGIDVQRDKLSREKYL
jgi:hypothetical protein